MILPHNHHIENEMMKIIEKIPNLETIAIVADSMKQLGDPTRLKIFWILCHTEECVINIAAMMDMSSPAIAHHLKKLKEANLICARRKGKEVYYQASDEPIVTMLHGIIESIANIICPKIASSQHPDF